MNEVNTHAKMGSRGYVDTFKKSLNKKIRLVKKEYVNNGEDITNENVLQQIREDAYNYFLSDDFCGDVSHDEWLDNTVGRMLLEDVTPYRVTAHIVNDTVVGEKVASDNEILSVMSLLAAREYARYRVYEELCPFISKALEKHKDDSKYKYFDFDGTFILAPGSFGNKKYVQKLLETASELKKESEGYVKAVVSVAVDGRIDVPVWVKSDMTHKEIADMARDEASFADLKSMDVIGMKPVNISFDDDSKDFDF